MFKEIIKSEARRIQARHRKNNPWLISLNKELSNIRGAVKSSASPSIKAVRICKTWKEFLIINYRNLVSKTNQYNNRHNHHSIEDRWKFCIISSHNRIRIWYRHRGIKTESKNTFLYSDKDRDWQNSLESAHTNLVKIKYNTGWKKLLINNATYIRKATNRSNGSMHKRFTPVNNWFENLRKQRDRIKVKVSTFNKDWERLFRMTITSMHNRGLEKIGQLNGREKQ
ncbi:hypothetical protein KAR91_88565 [Candidatus Pacearchaeota archaeon]|nr:hypothetical protein [Candidatus Pacearchaeota archaeon]